MDNRFKWVAVEYGPRRGGFYHYAKLLDTATGMTYDARCNYVNRTWEPWRFYSVKSAAKERAREALEVAALDAARDYRTRAGLPPIKRITKEFRRKALEFFGDVAAFKELDAVQC